MKRILKISLSLLMAVLLSSCSSWTVKRYLYEYEREQLEAEEFLPSGFASYDKVYYNHEKKYLLIFFTETMTVRVKYPEDFYNLKKAELDKEYTFLTEPIKSEWYEDDWLIPATEFDFDGFEFRVAANGEYPKKFGMVGYCDETREIAYLWYYDTDTDCICDSSQNPEQAMQNFTDYYFEL